MAYLSGKNGALSLGGAAYAFGKWSLRINGNPAEVTNFTSGGYYEDVGGVVVGDLTADGPYNSGAMTLAINSTYATVLTLVSGTTLAGTVRLSEISPTVDVKDAVRVSISAKMQGVFSSALA